MHAGVAAAVVYVESGWSVFPVRDKRPLEDWKWAQTRLATEAEIERWEVYGIFGLALATGELSRIVVLDLDLYKCQASGLDPDEVRQIVAQRLASTGRASATGGGGEHWYYTLPPGVVAPRNAARLWGLPVDLRGEGGYVVVPPTSGYAWLRECEPEELPEWKAAWTSEVGAARGEPGEKPPLSLTASVVEGQRNDHLARVAGTWLARGCSVAEALAFCIGVNTQFHPPLALAEVEAVVASVAATDARNAPEGHGVPWVEEGDFGAGGGGPPLPAFERVVSGVYAGRIKATLANVRLAVRDGRWLPWPVRWDDFHTGLGFGTGAGWQPMTDAAYVEIRARLEGHGFAALPERDLKDGILLAARGEGLRQDMLADWVERLPEWDGAARVDQALIAGFGAIVDDDQTEAYLAAVGRYLWTAMVGRATEGGCQADMMVILVSGQGTYKTSGVRELAPWLDLFGELHLGHEDTQLCLETRGKHVLEVSELRGMYTADMEKLKAYVSRRIDRWRNPYERFAISAPRRSVLVGTTNKEAFLRDPTGNRRWLPVAVEKGNPAWLREWREQLWAEAAVLWMGEGVAYRDAEAHAGQVHDRYRQEDIWTDEVVSFVTGWLARNPGHGVPALEIFTHLTKMTDFYIRENDYIVQKRISDILTSSGFFRTRRREGGGKRRYVYMKKVD